MHRLPGARLFMSYAWKDDQPFVARLYDDLRKLGCEPWMDTLNMPSRGRSLPREVEEQLQACDRVIAIMGPAAITSEACRAERVFAFNAGKVVTAILRKGEYAMLPPELSRYFVPDFRVSRPYEVAFSELMRILQDPPVRPGRLFDVPALPPHLQHRPNELRALCESLTTAELKETAVITSAAHVAVHGIVGVGKTVMASLAARDYTVRRQFQDGIIWLTFGREPNVLREVRRALSALGNDAATYNEVSLVRMQLGQALEGKECLLILDDLWSAVDAEPFVRAISPRCRLLITTRNLALVDALNARAHHLDVLTAEESRALLAHWSGSGLDALGSDAPDLLQECARLPLALAMVGAMLRGKPHAFVRHVANLLRNADLEAIKVQFPDYPYPNLLRAIQVSVDALDAKVRGRYLALAVLLEDMPVSSVIQQALWGADELDALETAEHLVSLSLAQRGTDAGSIRLHDLQFDYVRAQYKNQEALELIRGAVRLSWHVVGDDPRQFASQVVGRLLPHRGTADVRQFIRSLANNPLMTWLRPRWPSLYPAGTELRSTLQHPDSVTAVAISPDGLQVVSGSDDGTLRVWDIKTGRELRTWQGHDSKVNCLVITPDGHRVVSVSDDETLKVWELNTGRILNTLSGHFAEVKGVGLSTDGRVAVSASGDRTLRLWDLRTGGELRVLKGHTGDVEGVAVTADGRQAVSASCDGTVRVWDLPLGQRVRTIRGNGFSVFRVAVSRDGRRAIALAADSTLRVLDLETGRRIRTIRGSGYQGIILLPDGRHAVTSLHNERSLGVWDLGTGRLLRRLDGHSWDINDIVLSRDGNLAISASGDGTVKVWDLQQGHLVSTRMCHPKGVDAVAGIPGTKCAVSISCGESIVTLIVWDLKSGRGLGKEKVDTGRMSNVTELVVTPDGKQALRASAFTQGEYGELAHWWLEAWNLGPRLQRPAFFGNGCGFPTAVAVAPDGQRGVCAINDRSLTVWDLGSRRQTLTLRGHTDWVNAVVVTPDGRRAISASSDSTLRVWDLDLGLQVRMLEGHSGCVTAVAVNSDGRRAVSASSDETLKVWDLPTGRSLFTMIGTSGSARFVTISQDNLLVAAISGSKLHVWDLESSALLSTFTFDADARCCAWVDIRDLIVGDALGHVHLLSLESRRTLARKRQ